MTVPILVALAVDDVTAAHHLAAAAQATGVTALRLLDDGLDPTVVAGALAGRHGDLGYVVDVPTTHHAPYNTARRVLSLDRAGAGRTGLALRAGAGDEVSDGALDVATDVPPARRWAEYAHVLTRLWESFPRDALVGDAERAVVVDASRLRRVDHTGPAYRVAGPLDGPASVQGRPVLVADDVDVLGWAVVAAVADVVVVDVGTGVPGAADAALTAALADAGRRRDEVALVGRVTVDLADDAPVDRVHALVDALRARVRAERLDGLELVPQGGAAGALAAVRALVPLLVGTSAAGARQAGASGAGAPATLRTALRLPVPALAGAVA